MIEKLRKHLLLIPERFRRLSLAASVAVTLFATLYPFPVPEGFTAPRYTLDPLRGLKEILGMETGAWVVLPGGREDRAG